MGNPDIEHIDLRRKREPGDYPEIFSVHSSQIGGNLWGKLVERTRKLDREHGVSVGHYPFGRIVTSGIYQGDRTSVAPPLFVYGLHSLPDVLGLIEDIVHIHTHPHDPDTGHLKISSAHSDWDVHGVKTLGTPALMLDSGHAHLIIGSKEEILGDSLSVVQKVLSESGAGISKYEYMHQIIQAVAKNLGAAYQDRYFISSNKVPDDGMIVFRDATKLEDFKDFI